MDKCIIFIFLLTVSLFPQTWLMQNSGTSSNFMGVTFTDANHGIVLGYAGILLRTTDAGANWTLQASGTGNHLIQADFVDANNGTAVGAVGTIIVTTDGGGTWNPQVSGTGWDLYGVSFADPNHGTVVGSGGTILHTTDGGANWTSQVSGVFDHLIGVAFTDTNNGLVVGYSGIILKTTDGGANWALQTSGTFYDLYRVVFTDANNCFVVGIGGKILKSTNAGVSWNAQTIGTLEQLRDVSFTDANHGTVVGTSGVIFTTTNGGANWTAQPSGVTEGLYAVSFTDADNGTAVGFNGVILRKPLVPDVPVTTAASAILTNSFSANWNASAGALGYFLDVALDNLFTSFVTGYQNLNVGDVTTYSVNTNITAGAEYYYRVRASNTYGASANSNTTGLITIPAAPVATAGSSITRYSFTANWNATTGAAGYYLDVAKDNAFTVFVPGYQNLNVGAVTTYPVNALAPGYSFFYRVRAYNTSGTSDNSNSITVTTLPPLADLVTTASVNLPAPKNLEVLTYDFTITNNGPDTAKAVILQASIPRGFKYGSSSAVSSTYDHITGVWNVGTLVSGASASLTVVDTVDYFNQAYDFRDFYEFNAFTKHTADLTGVFVGGKLAAGHELHIIGSAIGQELRLRSETPDVVIAGDNLNFESGTVHYGNVVYGNTTNLPTPGVVYPHGTLIHGSPINFAAQGIYLDELSTGLHGYDVNGAVVVNGSTLELTGTDIYLNVFTVTKAQLEASTKVSVVVPKGAVAVINVDGATVNYTGSVDLHGNAKNFVLFNFWEATQLGFTGAFIDGSVLAPFADVQAIGSLFLGQLFSNNLLSTGPSIQNHSFIGYIPLNRTISFTPVVTSSFSVDPAPANNYTPATVVINTTAPYGTGGTGLWSVASVLPVNEMVISMTRLDTATILAGTNLGRIYAMDNNGVLGDVLNASMTPVAYIHSLAVNDSGHIFAATESGLYRSNDHGATWTTLLPGKEVRAILFGAGGYIYAGTWSFGVYRSDDFGYTWVQKNDNLTNTVIHALMDRSNYAPQYTVFAGTFGRGVSATYNYANTWMELPTPYDFVTCMNKTNEGIIFIGTLTDGVYRSYDNGNTWNHLSGLPDGPIYAIRVDGLNNIFVSSWMFGIYASADLGDSWSYLGLGGYGISATFPGPNNKFFAAGSNGKIYVNNSPMTGLRRDDQPMPMNYSLDQNYPNPFNPTTTIQFALPENANVKINIYNSLGEKIVELANGNYNAGYHSLQWNAAGIPSGIYFYELRTEKFSSVKKLILLK